MSRRSLGWLAALVAAGCGKSDDVYLGGDYTTAAVISPSPSQELDVLFVIDSSASMLDEQQTLGERAREALFDTIAELGGGATDLHVGVITSSLDAGSACNSTDGAALQLPDCAGSEPFFASGDRFLVEGPSGANFDDFGTAFGCLIQVGTAGCGMEQPLAALTRAISGDVGLNAGFLRPSANLLVIVMSDEDDCSAADLSLFDPERTDYGPLDSYRCFAAATTCREDLYSPGEKHDCRAREDGPLVPLGDLADEVIATKGDPSKVAVAVITGGSRPVEIQSVVSSTGQPSFSPLSCAPGAQLTDGAFPAYRLEAFADAFPGRSTKGDLCAPLESQLQVVGELGADSVAGTGCLRGRLADMDHRTAGLQPGCRAFEVVNGERQPVGLSLVADPRACGHATGLRAVLDRGGRPARGYTVVECTPQLD